MVTNLGRIPFETGIGDLRITTIWGPLALLGYQEEHAVGVATTNGSLCMIVASRSPFPDLLDDTARILAAACDGV
jgi:hypothetical protein